MRGSNSPDIIFCPKCKAIRVRRRRRRCCVCSVPLFYCNEFFNPSTESGFIWTGFRWETTEAVAARALPATPILAEDAVKTIEETVPGFLDWMGS